MNGRSGTNTRINLPPSNLDSNESSVDSDLGGHPERYQLHFWISAREYRFLRILARANDEPIARIMRRMIQQRRLQQERR